MGKQNVNDVYRQRRNEVGALLDLIGQEVKMHAEFAEKDGLHWGHVGDLGHLKELLVDALASVSQQDEAFVEAALEDLRNKGD